MTAWYDGDWSKPQASTLYWLRLPIVVCGVFACLMVYLIGVQIHGRFVGVIAACLVAVNPLFYTLSRRALFDIPAEAFVLATVALTLSVWPKLLTRRVHPRAWAWFIGGGGLFAALAILSKLNGAVALVFLPAWLIGGIAAGTALPRLFHRADLSKQAETTAGGSKAQGVSGARIGAANLVLAPIAICGVVAVALSVMLALNPFFTSVPPLGKLPTGDYEARRIRDLGPLSRFAFLFEFRMKWSQAALADPEWKRYWLPDIPTRIRAVFWQGFGRYGPFGKRRANWHAGMRDPATGEELEHLLPRTWPAVWWFPLCLIGFLWLLRDGGVALAAGGTPIQWGAALYMAAAVSAVTLTVPLAWDRYFLPLVPAGTLAAVYGVVRCLGWLGSRFVLEPPKSGE